MRRHALWLLLFTGCGQSAFAQGDWGMDDAKLKKYAEEHEMLFARCGQGSAEWHQQWTHEPPLEPKTYSLRHVYSVVGWTGACIDGKRDGVGVFSDRQETFDLLPSDSNLSYWITSTSEGTFVRGKKAGLWCTTVANHGGVITFASQVPPIACRLEGTSVNGSRFRKQADGRWQLVDELGQVAQPVAFVAAGSVESESARLITEAREGKASAPVVLAMQSDSIGDVIRGGRITEELSTVPIDLKAKRVAVMLSTGTITELARFSVVRQSLLDASAKDRKAAPFRQAFLEASDPAKLVEGLTLIVRKHAKSVVAAQDLTAFKDPAIDYVLILNWAFSGNMLVTPKEYQAHAPCRIDEDHEVRCPVVMFDQTASAWLVDRQLRLVRKVPIMLAPWPFGRTDAEASRGYETMLEGLASDFHGAWKAETGILTGWFDSSLKLNPANVP